MALRIQGNVSHVAPTIHPHIKIGSRNLVGHTHRFRRAAASVHGDEALIKGAKIMALMETRVNYKSRRLSRHY